MGPAAQLSPHLPRDHLRACPGELGLHEDHPRLAALASSMISATWRLLGSLPSTSIATWVSLQYPRSSRAAGVEHVKTPASKGGEDLP